MSIEYIDIPNTVQEKGNMGGISQQIYFAPKSDFAELAKKPLESGNRSFGGMNKLSVGTDRMKPGKRLYELYSTLEKGSLVAERQGEWDGVSHKVNLKVYTPGMKAESLDMLMIPNQDWIFYIETGEQMFRLGNSQFAAKLAAEGSVGTGDTTASGRGNEMTFTSYEVGFAGEVVSPDAIKAMVNAVDTGLTVVFLPAHGAVNVLVDANPTITFGEAVVNADTLAAFTSQQFQDILTLNEVDIDGVVGTAKPFTAVIVGNVVTVTPTSDFAAATIYELRFIENQVLSSDVKGRINGSSYVRFTTA